ncbi:hypothetical protein TWF225_006663 [Orbilia oligospora]|uniref:Uncharacterized protein n=1 Tax=Orbilia oligospora TaxID=2813651 RepID=A0A7C8PP42_ORBOL|nr:hypothetical protein TWF751_007971 [Orbilia oligospora]KAF3181624.1 hypothetical protein TWF225_006663 [Orbilia oligospora]KAF3253274.1 hypothetical protein TWF217_007532 [Orbilia oligospora]KAF3255149.1 hypothetical protein TWF128_005953 [Orbilia oligospora]KAF3298317.1 hypothetical protein TWF132_000145 [Orbilia oligospora]
MMDSLRQELDTLLCKCEDGDAGEERKFMPFQSFRKVFTPERIDDAVYGIKEADMEFSQKGDVAAWVKSHARRIFAILILLGSKEHLIAKFMGRDIFQGKYDEKLPFSREDLDTIIPEIAAEFYEKQWEFVSPVWSKNVVHRELPSDVRLPFVLNEKLGRGGFGVVYKIKLHEHHQRTVLFPENKNQQIVRKEFRSAPPRVESQLAAGSRSDSASTESDYAKELRNLSILNELKHPNIIQLVTSYTYRGKHNLVFPLIEDGDLGKLLRGNREDYPSLRRNESFLIALCELSSAIERVHDYTVERFDIKLMGCHYDLKPQNILVQGSKFILADFGLSRLSADSDSQLFAGGGSDYFAPECTDPEKDFAKKAIDRSSDVWSFGCIISEILTYMKMGPTGVKTFRERRKVLIKSQKVSAFHKGIGQRNQNFDEWLLSPEVQDGTDGFSRNMVNLIKRMTTLDQKSRPIAKEVTVDLQKTTIQALYFSVWGLYKSLQGMEKLKDSFEAYSEYMRIKSWGFVLGFDPETQGELVTSSLPETMPLVEMYKCLAEIQEELEATIERCEDCCSPLFGSLRSLGDKLYDTLPSEVAMKASAHWEIEMIRTENLDTLLETAEAAENVNTKIATLARIKRMSVLATAQPSGLTKDGLEISPDSVREGSPFENHLYASVESAAAPKRKVLIEWIRYSIVDTNLFEKLLVRIKSLAVLLNSIETPPDFRILHCSNYLHKGSDGAFGLVFDLPDQSVSVPRSLAAIIHKTRNFRERPSLGSRFKLALSLAVSLSGFHKVGWLHKSISASNVLLLIDPKEAESTVASTWLTDSYLIGFNRSREDDIQAFTLGQTRYEQVTQYYHPDYAQTSFPHPPYRLHYDYYSLGLVLLEVGMWESLSTLVKGVGSGESSRRRNTSVSNRYHEMRGYLVQKRLIMLGHTMGEEYQAAVQACLSGFEGLANSTSQARDNVAMQLKFEEEVVQRLRKCHA